jgi:integrase
MPSRYTIVAAPAGFDGFPTRRKYYFKTKNAGAEFRSRIKRWKAEQKSPSDTLSFDQNDMQWLAYLRAHVGNLEQLPAIVTHWERTAKSLTNPLTVTDLVEAFTAFRKARKPPLDRATLGEDKFVTTRFAAFAGELPAHEVTASVVRKFLATATGEQIARKLYKVTSIMFDYARAERVIVVNPFDEIDRPQVSYASPAILTPEQFATRLRHADKHFPELVPFLATAGFSGVRREELLREYADDQVLQWSDFLWDKKLILVRPEVAKKTKRKTGNRRFVPIEPALEYWLKPIAKTEGPVVELADSWFRKRYAKLCAAVEQKPGRNELRHSYASYSLARTTMQGLGRLALAMGNSETICKQHYVESLMPAEGEAWFEIRRKGTKKPKASAEAVPPWHRPKFVPLPLQKSA